MTLKTSANCKLFIGTTAAATTLSAFEADTYTEIGDIEDLGEFGDQFNAVTFTSLGDGRVRKLKGTKDAGDMSLVVALDTGDAGQTALKNAAADSKQLPYSIKVTLDDQITPTTGNPTTYYFKALVMGSRIAIGGADNVIRRNVALAIDSALIEKAAV